MDTAFLDSVGLGYQSLMETNGSVATEKFDDIMKSLNNDAINVPTRKVMAEQLSTWSFMVPANIKEQYLMKAADQIFSIVQHIVINVNDGEKNYDGAARIAEKLCSLLLTCGQMDQTQKFSSAMAPKAYKCLEEILNSGVKLQQRPFSGDTCESVKTEVCANLLRMMPYSGTVNVPNGFLVVSKILLNDYPASLKTQAKSTLSTMAQVNKECMKHCGMEIMELIASGGYDDLIFTFSSMPELYKNKPEAVHKHLGIIFNMNYMHVCSLIYTVSQTEPKVLVPYLETLIAKLQEAANMGAVTLMTLKEVGNAAPEKLYPLIPRIVDIAKTVQNGNVSLASVIGAAAKAKNPADAGDRMLPLLMDLLTQSTESTTKVVVLSELSAIREHLTSRDALKPFMATISKHRNVHPDIVTNIEDFFAGRSLETLTNRVDEMEAKINELNNRVAESCSSFEDVMAYVDAHVADLKDFIGDVVKKLPSPKRLEVVGTLRKTLILHFECVRTGYEFPIVSKEWSKWLKMGFSLAKAGKAVIDIGMGNPLGLLSTGIDCVKGIYEAYQSNDDDEFNTYITNPFLTSTEQDGLIEKLRDQGFFEKMAYDNQLGGWYLLNPERDGVPPAGEAGSVTKVKSKKGYGVMDTASDLAMQAIKHVNPDVAENIELAASFIPSGEQDDPAPSPLHTPSKAGSAPGKAAGKPAAGGRAANVRAQMGVAEGSVKLELAENMLDYGKQIAKMEQRISRLEQEVVALRENAQSGGCCIVS